MNYRPGHSEYSKKYQSSEKQGRRATSKSRSKYREDAPPGEEFLEFKYIEKDDKYI